MAVPLDRYQKFVIMQEPIPIQVNNSNTNLLWVANPVGRDDLIVAATLDWRKCSSGIFPRSMFSCQKGLPL